MLKGASVIITGILITIGSRLAIIGGELVVPGIGWIAGIGTIALSLF
mgnify:CR=1 FL=1